MEIIPAVDIQQILQQPDFPLSLKSVVLQIASNLYNYSHLRTVDYIIEDLNRMISLIDGPDGVSFIDMYRTSVEDYLFWSCIPCLTRIARQSRLFQDDEVVSAMRSARREQQIRASRLSSWRAPEKLFNTSLESYEYYRRQEVEQDMEFSLSTELPISPSPQRVSSPSYSSISRVTVGGCQPSLYFDAVLSLLDALFANNGSLLMILNREGSQILENALHIEWLLAATSVLVTKFGAGEKDGNSRFSFVLRALHEKTIHFLHWVCDTKKRRNSVNFIRRKSARAFNESLRKALVPNGHKVHSVFGNIFTTNTRKKRKMMRRFYESFDVNYNDGFAAHEVYSRLMRHSVLYNVFVEFTSSAQQLIKFKEKEREGDGVRVMSRDALRFKKGLSSFDKWSNCSGRYLQNLFHYIGWACTHEKDNHEVSCAFLDMFRIMLKNNVDRIREETLPLHLKTKVESESRRVQEIQNTLNMYGASDAVLQLIGRAKYPDVKDPYFSYLIPSVLSFGYSLMDTGNRFAQNHLIDKFYSANLTLQLPEMDSILALRHLLRACTTEISIGFKVDGSLKNVGLLNNLLKLFGFCSRLCNAHNERARYFLREQDKSARSADIVQDVVAATNCLLEALVSRMRYIRYEGFTERLAPMIWPEVTNDRRRFIAWHEYAHVKFDVVCRLLHAVGVAFDVLKDVCQGPCPENQSTVLRATAMCPAVLEYIGAMHLKAESSVSTIIGLNRKIVWKGYDPYVFYLTYERELKNLRLFHLHPSKDDLIEFVQMWGDTRSSVFHPGIIRGRKKKNESILGVDLDLLLTVARDTEFSCIRMLLALMEGSDKHIISTLKSSLNEGILLQNMENVYYNGLQHRNKNDKSQALFVLYLTLIETLASEEDSSSYGLDDLLSTWKDECRRAGGDVDSLVASVEIVGKNNSIQRTYFPMPEFCSRFWSYPETQKAKEDLLANINRDSPEEKIADFYRRMHMLYRVMRRQQVLRYILKPYFHAFLGGSSGVSFLDKNRFFPDQRKVFLYMSLLVNLYWLYIDFQEHEIGHGRDYIGGGLWRKFENWEHQHFLIIIFFGTHFGIACLLLMRDVLNSRAADEMEPIELPGMSFAIVRFIANIIDKLRAMILVYSESWWKTSCMVACFGGFWGILYDMDLMFLYSVTLLDIAPQIESIAFLMEAMRRNVSRIFWSMVIIVIILYIYSVAAYVSRKISKPM